VLRNQQRLLFSTTMDGNQHLITAGKEAFDATTELLAEFEDE